MIYWKKTWPDWWSISITKCGTSFQVALSGQINITCDLATYDLETATEDKWNGEKQQKIG